jgi:hypothetical protein
MLSSRHGDRVSYRDTEPATTRFTVQRKMSGVRKAGGCVVPQGKPAPKPKRCTFWRSVGSFSHRDDAGADHFHFTGRVKHHALASGRYRLRAVASLHGLTSNRIQAGFRIEKP